MEYDTKNFIDQTGRIDDLEARVARLEDGDAGRDDCNCWKNAGPECVSHLFGGQCYYDR